MRQGLATWKTTGARIAVPLYLTLLAEGYTKAGQFEEAWHLTTEALEVANRTGERFCEAELYRLQGQLLLAGAGANQHEGERCFQQALTIAGRQQAKFWELRAAMNLGQLWQKQGKRDPARQLLGEAYRCFKEGFDTPDLREAGTLLKALA